MTQQKFHLGEGPVLVAALSLVTSLGPLWGCYRGPPDPNPFGSGTDSAGGGTAGDEGSTGGGPVDPAPQDAHLIPEGVARRLTQSELNNSLRDLVGDADQPAFRFLNESEYTPFDNDYAFQDPSKAYVESMEALAQDVADRFVADPARLAQFVPCTPTGADDSTCFRDFVASFGRAAFRRPLTSDEVDAYSGLQAFATEANDHVDNDFYTGIRIVVLTILQDPEFLYRIEVGTETTAPGVFKLNEFEIASRLSFLLWGSIPDDELLQDAEGGMLEDTETRGVAVERMLEDPKAREQMNRYHAMWLGYRGIPHTQELVTAFNSETSALIERVVFDERLAYSNLFTLNETYIDGFLAEHYGLTSPGAGSDWVPYDDSGRSGILGHGAVLAAFSKFTDTSPTQRGIFIRERLMCMEVPPPPPDIDADSPPGDPNDPVTCKEDRYAAHREIESCAACHALFDPIGMGLENYDLGGAFRTADDGNPECAISGEGELPGVGTFNGPKELADRLLESGKLEACVIRHYMTFAYGREVHEDEQEQLDAMLGRFEQLDYDFAGFITAHASDELFGFRKEPSE